MARLVLIQAALFLAPFALYALYLLLSRRSMPAPDNWHPLAALALAGLILMAAGFVALGFLDQSARVGTYHPAELRDGVLTPGHIE